MKRHEKQDDEIEDHKNAIQIIETVFEALEYMNKAGWLYGKREKDIVAIIQKLIEKL